MVASPGILRWSLLLLGGHAWLARSLDAHQEFSGIRKMASDISGDIISWRRNLHRWPELMYQEHNTSRYIQEVLQSIGVSFTAGWGKNTRQERIPGEGGTGVVAEIGTGKPPIVALRADIDALPILEETRVPFISRNLGKMHACGHDGHTSMLLGAAKLLHGVATTLAGTVRLIFQPAEEGGAGAKRMCEEGAMKGVSRIFGMHLWPYLPSGTIGGRAGTALAAGDMFELKIVGKGAHGAAPHTGIDPVTAAAAVISSLQTIVSREFDAQDSAVLSVTKVKTAGEGLNVIPPEVVIGGTFRSLTHSNLAIIRQRLEEVVTNVAAAHRCSVEGLRYMPDPFPPTNNDPELWEWIGSAEVGVGQGPAALDVQWDVKPMMGSEDFSFYAQQAPGAFIFLGQGSGEGRVDVRREGEGVSVAQHSELFPTNTTVHSPRFNMDESVLHLGAALHTHLAIRSLHELQSSPHAEL